MNELYDFDALKNFLQEQGLSVGEGKGYKLICVDFKEAYTNGKIEFDTNGIFYLDDNSFKRQGYMFQREYLVDQWGLPKFHIFKCNTIQNFLDGGIFDQYYSFSTADLNDITERRSKKIFKGSSLSLCGNCRKMLADLQAKELFEKSETSIVALLRNSIHDTRDFFDALGGGNGEILPDEVDVDMFGYVKDWQDISRYIREKNDYTCQQCKIELTGLERRFMEVHHINSIKLDNRESNLKCLCIKCHSEVDQYHKENYNEGSNRLRLKHFKEMLSKR